MYTCRYVEVTGNHSSAVAIGFGRFSLGVDSEIINLIYGLYSLNKHYMNYKK